MFSSLIHFLSIFFVLCLCSNAAKNKQYLKAMGFTHVLNTAEGSRLGQVDTGHAYYRDMPTIRYDKFVFLRLKFNIFMCMLKSLLKCNVIIVIVVIQNTSHDTNVQTARLELGDDEMDKQNQVKRLHSAR